jgi:hypothetical protein
MIGSAANWILYGAFRVWYGLLEATEWLLSAPERAYDDEPVRGCEVRHRLRSGVALDEAFDLTLQDIRNLRHYDAQAWERV